MFTNAMSATPAISVLMPVRNGAKFIEAALQSLAEQTFRHFEIVVVENGSTDETLEILAAWAQCEPRLRVARLAAAGLSSALNLAASLARAPLLARLDADDVALPTRLEVQMKVMASRPELVLLGSAAVLIDAAGRKMGALRPPLLDRDIRRMQRTSAALVSSSTMSRSDAFQRAGAYREGLNISEDFDLWLRMSEIGEIANLPDELIGYRIHGHSITARQPGRMAIASLAVVAAVEARSRGAAEPFHRGVPSLRATLPLLGLSRAQARRSVRVRSFLNGIGRRLGSVPVPLVVRRGLHWLTRTLRLKLLYRRWLRKLLRDREVEPRSAAGGQNVARMKGSDAEFSDARKS